MNLVLSSNSVVVFDLDDTLFKEVEFVYSAYRFISQKLEKHIGTDVYDEMCGYFASQQNTFDIINERYDFPFSIPELVEMYRYHEPSITPEPGSIELIEKLKKLKIPVGIITDGRTKTQTNKLRALGLHGQIDLVVISEDFGSGKPDKANYLHFEFSFPNSSHFVYIGDNYNKDFIAPNKLGWQTIGLLDNGTNIHSQKGTFLPELLPETQIASLEQIKIVYK